jgi:hypothetical protein
MNHPVPAIIPGGLPDPERPIRLARLEAKITELAAPTDVSAETPNGSESTVTTMGSTSQPKPFRRCGGGR